MYLIQPRTAIYGGFDVIATLVRTWQCRVPTGLSHPALELL
ncbi:MULTISPECIES: hypothetical protein [unclassified Trichocoleus]|nr:MULTISPECIES: hypothetical protein [unclassified Trichocoleus]